MSNFKNTQIQQANQAAAADQPKIIKFEESSKPVVEQFQFGKIQRDMTYAENKSKYGALSSADGERLARNRKDERFTLNPMSRERLSIEQEERRVIEEKVAEQLASVIEAAKTGGREQGYQDGLKRGFAEAFSKFQTEGGVRVDQLNLLVKKFDGLKEQIFKANERAMVEMIYRMTRMLTLKELALDKEYVLRLTHELIERVGVRDNIRVRINPAELESIGMIRAGLEKELGNLSNLKIEISDQVQRGGCELETDLNAIDASIETQLQMLHEALLGGEK